RETRRANTRARGRTRDPDPTYRSYPVHLALWCYRCTSHPDSLYECLKIHVRYIYHVTGNFKK
uniref:Uncharacterized protein n=1 Tax=Triticum urartu TaxID=4572 RepID=A0A8R7P2U2_TRIUA